LEGFFASSSPIDGLGALTGYWYLDVFACMNVILLCGLALSMDDETFRARDDAETRRDADASPRDRQP
jgi:hypothetical protein